MPPDVQHFLARLYTDDALRARFIADRAGVAREEGFGEAECTRLAAVDVEALDLAARGFARKRMGRRS
jgi:hypothetical protein